MNALSDNQKRQSSALWQRQIFGVSRAQFLSALIISIFALFWQGGIIAVSVLSGGILVGLNSVLLARSVVDSSLVERGDGRGVLYRSAVIRFLLLIIALIGANLMGLQLPAVAVGMLAAYVGGYFCVTRMAARAADEDSLQN